MPCFYVRLIQREFYRRMAGAQVINILIIPSRYFNVLPRFKYFTSMLALAACLFVENKNFSIRFIAVLFNVFTYATS